VQWGTWHDEELLRGTKQSLVHGKAMLQREAFENDEPLDVQAGAL
jgi:hypothetical protein